MRESLEVRRGFSRIALTRLRFATQDLLLQLFILWPMNVSIWSYSGPLIALVTLCGEGSSSLPRPQFRVAGW